MVWHLDTLQRALVQCSVFILQHWGQVPVCIYFDCIYFQHDGHRDFITFLSESFQGMQSPRTGTHCSLLRLTALNQSSAQIKFPGNWRYEQTYASEEKNHWSPGSRTTPFTVFTQNPAKSGLETCLGIAVDFQKMVSNLWAKYMLHSHQRECL